MAANASTWSWETATESVITTQLTISEQPGVVSEPG